MEGVLESGGAALASPEVGRSLLRGRSCGSHAKSGCRAAGKRSESGSRDASIPGRRVPALLPRPRRSPAGRRRSGKGAQSGSPGAGPAAPRWAPRPAPPPPPPFPQLAANAAASGDPSGWQQTLRPPAQERSWQSLCGRAHSLPALGTRPPAPLRRRGRGEQRAARDAPGSRRSRRRPRPSAAAPSLRLPGRGEGSRSPGAGAGAGTSPTCGGARPLPAAREGSARPLGARAPAGSRRQLMETFPGGAPGERSAPASPGAAVVSRARTGVTWASERAAPTRPPINAFPRGRRALANFPLRLGPRAGCVGRLSWHGGRPGVGAGMPAQRRQPPNNRQREGGPP